MIDSVTAHPRVPVTKAMLLRHAMAPSSELRGRSILITGGTGSFGTTFLKCLLKEHEPASVRIYSRDELKQSEMQRTFADDTRLRWLLGDVRDRERLTFAMRDIDVVIHAAALKQVPACEYNPFEAVKTNVVGTENVVAAAIANSVSKTIMLSTDKAVNPVNLYGATKLCAEKIVTQGNALAGADASRFATVRWGNVAGSRGSVLPLFKRQAESGTVTITDERMTRFWITLDQVVDFVIACLGRMQGGEIFIPRCPSLKIADLAAAVAPNARREVIGIRPGEKIHEVLVTEDESRHARDFADYIAIYPSFVFWTADYPEGKPLPPRFRYTSDTNDDWLDAAEVARAHSSGPSPIKASV